MDIFIEALFGEDNQKIPKEYDWFAGLIGDWKFDYYDGYDNETPRHVEGEWIFRRILNGAGIEDLFICPSRETMKSNHQDDGEYGLAIRMYNENDKCYDMVYTCEKYMKRLQFKLEEDKLVGTVLDNLNEKWVFSEIKKDTFHWQNITVLSDGAWKVNSDVYASRK